MEFAPAHQSYQRVKTTGFRTFIKKDGVVYEPFSDDKEENKMIISMNELELEEENSEKGLRVWVNYYVLPNERMGGLVRTFSVTNISDTKANVEVLDGMPALIPCGVNLGRIQAIGQTAKTWMQVEDIQEKIPYFRVMASLEDSAEVAMVEAGNFGVGFQENGSLLPVVIDPARVFGYDTFMRKAVCFEEIPLAELLEQEQVTANEFPCCFFGKEKVLEPGESLVFYEIYGQAQHKKC